MSSAFRRAVAVVLAVALGMAGSALLTPTPALADDEFVPVRAVAQASWGYADQATPLRGYVNPSGEAPAGA